MNGVFACSVACYAPLLLHIPSPAFWKINKRDLTDSGMRVADGVADGPAILLK